MVESITKSKLSDTVIDRIRSMVESGELKEGDKLPNQNEFATQLGVSRTVLREALQTLSMLNVVEQRPKLGTVIRAKTSLHYVNYLIPPSIDDAANTIELIEARRILEVGAVELAAKHATEQQLAKMASLVDQMTRDAKADNEVGYTENNVAFHFLIAEASHNRFVTHQMAALRGFMSQWMLESIRVLPGLRSRSLKAHRLICQAIRDRNPKKAAAEMKKHMHDLSNSLIRHYHIETEKSSG